MTYKACDANLRTSVTKLRKCRVEEAVLLPERFYIRIGMGFRGLECHVRVSDLWDRRAGKKVSTRQESQCPQESILQVEDYSEQEHKASNRKVNPLHVLQRFLIITDMVEDGVRANYGSHDRSNSAIIHQPGCINANNPDNVPLTH